VTRQAGEIKASVEPRTRLKKVKKGPSRETIMDGNWSNGCFYEADRSDAPHNALSTAMRKDF
jgi:hypothetical protein